MTATLFKSLFLPNADGSDSATALTDVNTVWVHTYLGSDTQGDGTRAKPYKTVYKANLKSGPTYILFRGLCAEVFTNKMMIGDDINCKYIFTGSIGGYLGGYLRLTMPVNHINNLSDLSNNLNIIDDPTYSTLDNYRKVSLYVFIRNNIGSSYNNYDIGPLNIYITFNSYLGNGNNRLSNSIATGDMYNNLYCVYDHCIFLASTVHKSSTGNIILPAFVSDSTSNIELLRLSYLCAGFISTDIDNIFPKTNGIRNTKVVNESRTGGTKPNVLNSYASNLTANLNSVITATAKTQIVINVSNSSLWTSSGNLFLPTESSYTANSITMPIGSSEVFTYTSVVINNSTQLTLVGTSYTFKLAHNSLTKTCTRYGDVLDFTLNTNVNNDALYASSVGGYVGCFKPVVASALQLGGNGSDTIINVNSDGTDSVTTGTLLVKNSNASLSYNLISGQKWNRFRSQVIYLGIQLNFSGINGITTDGTMSGTYFGKYQQLLSSNTYSDGDTLTVGTWYKVIGTSKLGSSSISYNNTTYLPGYTFLCITGVTVYELKVSGSGTVVKAILSTPMESVEILPYSDLTTPHIVIPSFSCPLFGDVKMLFNKTSLYGIIGAPVKFSDTHVVSVCGLQSPTGYYDNWGITNADSAFTLLATDTVNYYYAVPNIRYYKTEINGHYDSDYGQ